MHLPYGYAGTDYVYMVQTSSGDRSQVERNVCLPDLTSSSFHLLAWLLMRSHKCHIASLGGTTSRNINMGVLEAEWLLCMPHNHNAPGLVPSREL